MLWLAWFSPSWLALGEGVITVVQHSYHSIFFSLISFWFISSKIPAGMSFNLLPVLMIILKPFTEMIIW